MNKESDYEFQMKFIKNIYTYSEGTININFLAKHILGFDGEYCPKCFNNINKFDEKTMAPFCDCGWKGNMLDLLPEKEAFIKKRKEKLKKLENDREKRTPDSNN